MPIVDMDNVSNYTVYPSGTYRAVVNDWEFSESKKKHTKQVKIKTTIELKTGSGAYTEFIPLTDASSWKVGKFISACGLALKGKLDTSSPLFAKVLNSLKGRSVYITLEVDNQYNNNKSVAYHPDDQQESLEWFTSDDAPEFVKG